MAEILTVKNLSKEYNDKIALSDLSFSVNRGDIFGFIGPNGAGKTTMIRIINQIIFQSSGEIRINSELLNPKHAELIGYMPEERGLYPKMKVGEQIVFLAQLRGLSEIVAKTRAKEWLEKFDLGTVIKKKVMDLSKGMQQKVQFIATVIHQPQILILDEPLSGLDPVNANLVNQEIMNLKARGTTIIFSTHRMEQVEQICDQVLIINKGQKLLEGGVKEIKNRFKENIVRVEFTGDTSAKILNSNFKVVKTGPNYILFSINEGQTITQLVKFLVDSDLQLIAFAEVLPSLNDIFIKEVTK